MRVTHATRCTAVLTPGTTPSFWSRGLFWSKAAFDASPNLRKALMSVALMQALGFTFATSTSNPPGTVIGADGTLQYGAHNLLTSSEKFDNNADWVRTSTTVTPDVVVAPDGQTTADALLETAVTNFFRFIETVTVANATTYAFSVYLKAGARNWVLLNNDTLGAGAYFNLASGVVGNVGGGITPSITPVGNGWYRCSIGFTTASTTAGCAIYLASANGTVSYTGVASSGVYAWGAQLNRGVLLDYVATTSAAIYAPRQQYDRGASSNSLKNSDDLTQADWTAITVTAANSGTPPAGYSSSQLVTNTNGGGSRFTQDVTIASSGTWTYTVALKQGSGNTPVLLVYDVTGSAIAKEIDVDWSSLSLGPGAGVALGGGWYEFALTFTATAAHTYRFYVYPPGSIGQTVYFAGSNLNPGLRLPHLKTTSTAPLTTNGTPTAQNLIPNTDLTSGTWVASSIASIVASSDRPPDGSLSWELTPSGGSTNSGHFIRTPNSSVAAGTVYTYKLWIKCASGTINGFNIGPVWEDNSATYKGDSGTTVNLTTAWQQVVIRGVASPGSQLCRFNFGDAFTWVAAGGAIRVGGVSLYEGTADLPQVVTAGTPYSLYPQLGALLEDGRTNLTKWACDFSNAAWQVANGTSAKVTGGYLDPAGGIAGYEWNPGSTGGAAVGGAGAIYETVGTTPATATAYTVSCYVRTKNGAASSVRISMYFGGGETETGSADLAIDGTWKRIAFTRTSSGTVGSDCNVSLRNNVAGNSGNLIVWGFQFEAGSFATSLIPTTSAAVARNDDKITHSSLAALGIGTTQGTLAVGWIPQQTAATAGVLQVSDGTGANRLLVQQNGTGTRNLEFVSSVAQVATLDFSSVAAAGAPMRDAVRYKAAAHGASLNGSAVLTNSYNGVPAGLNLLEVGAMAASGDACRALILTDMQFSTQAANDATVQRAALGLVA